MHSRTLRTTLLVACFLMSAVSAALGQGVITTIAGTDWIYRGDTGPALNAPLGQIWGVALDAAGNLFAADIGNHLVVRISPNGVLTAVAGNGVAAFSGDGGSATSASLSYPMAAVFDATGNLYIGDRDNSRIRKVSPNGTITTVAGSGVAGFSGDGGPATLARLRAPSGVAVDSAGNLYVSDGGDNRIRKVRPGGIIATVAGNGAAGFSGDGGPASAASLNWPQGLALDAAGNLYIADRGNSRIREVNVASGIITTVAGAGRGYSGDGGPATAAKLITPAGVAVDSDGSIYIADFDAYAIRRVNPQGTITTVAGGNGNGFSGDGGPATKAKLNWPRALAFDAAGNLFIGENPRIRKVSPSGVITTVAGNGRFRFSGDGGPAVSATLASPVRAALDVYGNLYIADWRNNRVRKVAADGTITTLAGNGTPDFFGDGGPATSASLNGPDGVAVSPTGDVYIADRFNYRVRKVGPDGTITTVAGGGSNYPGDGGPATAASLVLLSGLVLDAAGNLYIVDNDRVRKVTPAGIISTVAGTGVAGFSGDGGPATAATLFLSTGVSAY